MRAGLASLVLLGATARGCFLRGDSPPSDKALMGGAAAGGGGMRSLVGDLFFARGGPPSEVPPMSPLFFDAVEQQAIEANERRHRGKMELRGACSRDVKFEECHTSQGRVANALHLERCLSRGPRLTKSCTNGIKQWKKLLAELWHEAHDVKVGMIATSASSSEVGDYDEPLPKSGHAKMKNAYPDPYSYLEQNFSGLDGPVDAIELIESPPHDRHHGHGDSHDHGPSGRGPPPPPRGEGRGPPAPPHGPPPHGPPGPPGHGRHGPHGPPGHHHDRDAEHPRSSFAVLWSWLFEDSFDSSDSSSEDSPEDSSKDSSEDDSSDSWDFDDDSSSVLPVRIEELVEPAWEVVPVESVEEFFGRMVKEEHRQAERMAERSFVRSNTPGAPRAADVERLEGRNPVAAAAALANQLTDRANNPLDGLTGEDARRHHGEKTESGVDPLPDGQEASRARHAVKRGRPARLPRGEHEAGENHDRKRPARHNFHKVGPDDFPLSELLLDVGGESLEGPHSGGPFGPNGDFHGGRRHNGDRFGPGGEFNSGHHGGPFSLDAEFLNDHPYHRHHHGGPFREHNRQQRGDHLRSRNRLPEEYENSEWFDSMDEDEGLVDIVLGFFFIVGASTLLLFPFFLLARALKKMGRRGGRSRGDADGPAPPAPSSSVFGFAARRRAHAASVAAAADGYQALPEDAGEGEGVGEDSDDDAIVVTGTPVNPPPSVHL